jgi:signal transduction histidine kinase
MWRSCYTYAMSGEAIGTHLERGKSVSPDAKELEVALVAASTPASKVDVLNEWAWTLREEDPRRAITLAQAARKLATTGELEQAPYTSGWADSLNHLGQLYRQQGEHNEALPLLKDAQALYNTLGEPYKEVRVRCTIGSIYREMGVLTMAQEDLFEALQLAEKNLDGEGQALAMTNIGQIFIASGNFDRGRFYLHQALELGRTNRSQESEAQTLAELAHASLGMGEYGNALAYCYQSLEIYRNLGDRVGEAEVHQTIGEVYLALRDAEQAQEHLDRSLAISSEIGMRYREGRARLVKADLLETLGETDAAFAQLQQALAIGTEIHADQLRYQIHERLYRLHKALGNSGQALGHFEQYIKGREQSLEESTSASLRTMQIAYDLKDARQAAELYQIKTVDLEREVQARIRAEGDLQEQLQRRQVIVQVHDELSHSFNLADTLITALDAGLRLSGASGGFVALTEAGGVRLAVEQLVGEYNLDVGYSINMQHYMVADLRAVGQTQRLIYIRPVETSGFPTQKGTRARFLMPLFARNEFIGLLNLETPHPERFSDNVFQLLQMLESYYAITVDNVRLYDSVNEQLLEKEHLYEQLSDLERLKSDMIRIAAHDLRGPLSNMLGYLYILDHKGSELTPEQSSAVEGMRKSVERMNNMIKDILSLERIEQVATTASYEPANFYNLVEEAVRDYARAAAEKSIELTLDAAGNEHLLFHGDPTQIYEATSNLLSNAIKYTPGGGTVRVSIKEAVRDIELYIHDTGYGIPDDQQDRLFTPFFRAKTEESVGIPGTGLGLNLVKSIVERHNGYIIFESIYGGGSTFGFGIPLYTGTASYNRPPGERRPALT